MRLENNSTQPEDLPPEEPPAYEAPPDYEEVITVGMEDQMNVKQKTNRTSDRHKTRNIHLRLNFFFHISNNITIHMLISI